MVTQAFPLLATCGDGNAFPLGDRALRLHDRFPVVTMDRITRAWIDQYACRDHEICITECPEVFQILPGESSVSVEPDADQYFQTRDRDIRSAMACCPMACIHITEADD